MTQAFAFLASGPFLLMAARTPSLGVLIAGLIAFGLGRGFYDCNIMPLLCQIAPQNVRATGYGIFNFVGNFMGGATAVAAGALKNSMGLSAAIQIGAVIWLSSGALLLVAWRKKLLAPQPCCELDTSVRYLRVGSSFPEPPTRD
ncbi:MAG: hypothetical protein JOZ62_06970 [Acidobacteriaceae bacterium]|nr:hypothetical protein [Acidobacteriaceae bacterium]